MFEIGKIPPEILEKIVMKPMMGSKVKRDDVILRPTTGEDCSAIDLGGEFCILSTDPITGAAADIGYLAVQINCNDIYSAGAEPMGVLLTVLLPPGSGEDLLEEIMAGSLRAAEERNIEILGGLFLGQFPLFPQGQEDMRKIVCHGLTLLCVEKNIQ